MTDVLKGLHPSAREALKEGHRIIRDHVEAEIAAQVEGLSDEEARALLQRQMEEQEARRLEQQRAWDEAHGIPLATPPGPATSDE